MLGGLSLNLLPSLNPFLRLRPKKNRRLPPGFDRRGLHLNLLQNLNLLLN